MNDHVETPVGVDRRDFIKRGAIVGGMVWAAPLVQSLGSPAFAQGGTNGDEQCTYYCNFKVEKVGGIWTFVDCELGEGNCPTSHWALGSECCVVNSGGTASSATGTINNKGTITILFSGTDQSVATISFSSSNCKLLDGDAKAGSINSPSQSVECFDFTPSGSSYVATAENDAGAPIGISNIVGTVCC
jgi:hypothetical protein